MRITYDEAKRLRTLEDRGLDFKDAAEVFAGDHYTRFDRRYAYGEERAVTIGLVDGVAVIMVWTERDASRRVISMRKADRDERRDYNDRLAGS